MNRRFRMIVLLLLLLGASSASAADEIFVLADRFVMGDLKQAAVTFIDVRDVAAHRQARIPGSFSIPLYAIKTKPYLKDKKVVVVDAGLVSSRVEAEISRLRAAGFKDLAVLRDGLRGWRAAGGALEGELPASAAVGTITVADFHEAGPKEDWLLVDARSDAQVKSGENLGSSFKRLPYSGKPAVFAKKLKVLARGRKPAVRVVIFTEQGDGYDDLEPEIRKLAGLPVHYLSGGMAAYTRHLSLETSLKKRREVKLADNSYSGSRFGGGTRRGGGCGSCP